MQTKKDELEALGFHHEWVVYCRDCGYYIDHKCQRLWGGMLDCKSYSYCSDGVLREAMKGRVGR